MQPQQKTFSSYFIVGTIEGKGLKEDTLLVVYLQFISALKTRSFSWSNIHCMLFQHSKQNYPG